MTDFTLQPNDQAKREPFKLEPPPIYDEYYAATQVDDEIVTRDWPTPETRPDLLPKPESESVLTRLCRAIGWGREGL